MSFIIGPPVRCQSALLLAPVCSLVLVLVRALTVRHLYGSPNSHVKTAVAHEVTTTPNTSVSTLIIGRGASNKRRTIDSLTCLDRSDLTPPRSLHLWTSFVPF